MLSLPTTTSSFICPSPGSFLPAAVPCFGVTGRAQCHLPSETPNLCECYQPAFFCWFNDPLSVHDLPSACSLLVCLPRCPITCYQLCLTLAPLAQPALLQHPDSSVDFQLTPMDPHQTLTCTIWDLPSPMSPAHCVIDNQAYYLNLSWSDAQHLARELQFKINLWWLTLKRSLMLAVL